MISPAMADIMPPSAWGPRWWASRSVNRLDRLQDAGYQPGCSYEQHDCRQGQRRETRHRETDAYGDDAQDSMTYSRPGMDSRHYAHGDEDEGNHDDHDEEGSILRWRAVPETKIRFILTGDSRHQIHRLGTLDSGKWRVRNFHGVEVRVFSDDGRCARPRTGARILVDIGPGCGSDIEPRVRNPEERSYRLWMTKIG